MKWIDAFLYSDNRVVVNGIKSDWFCAQFLVAFCSVCTSMITSDIESEIRLFADDCVCYREIKNKENTLKLLKYINRLGSCARKWDMQSHPFNAT